MIVTQIKNSHAPVEGYYAGTRTTVGGQKQLVILGSNGNPEYPTLIMAEPHLDKLLRQTPSLRGYKVRISQIGARDNRTKELVFSVQYDPDDKIRQNNENHWVMPIMGLEIPFGEA